MKLITTDQHPRLDEGIQVGVIKTVFETTLSFKTPDLRMDFLLWRNDDGLNNYYRWEY